VVFQSLKLLLVFMLLAGLPQLSLAAPTPAEGNSSAPTGGPRKQLATIMFAGIAGAILGLSTLSFYGRPQDKLSNIAVGFAIGVITGTVYTTYKAAASPREFYRGAELWEQLDKEREQKIYAANQPIKLNWTFHF
jgi:hypothetical protein